MDVKSKLQDIPVISFQTGTFDHVSFAHTYYLRIVKNVLRRAQMQWSCSKADRAHWIECGKIKGIIICNIFIHRISDIIRRSMVFVYHNFQNF